MEKIELPKGLGLRLATPADQPFIASLFHSTREAFYIAEQEEEYVRMVIDHQLELQTEGYGAQSPDSMSFIIEKQGTAIGRLVLDFGKNIAHIKDIALIREARNLGYGKSVIQAVQYTAQKQSLPVGLTVDAQNPALKKFYQDLGFKTEESNPTHEFMVWYPTANKVYVDMKS